jgi:hypothetical protein
MNKSIICLLLIVGTFSNGIHAQRIFEAGLKPTELAFLNFETNLAIGNKKARYGIILGYRPSTQDSGLVKSGGSGMHGGYGHNYLNRLYRGYTFGIYQKTYLNGTLDFFIETDLFYRNWNFKNKPAEFRNAEGYEFNGVRTESQDVYGLKLVAGKTFMLTSKPRKANMYLDAFIGAGFRYQEMTYETFNGFVGETYYSYKMDRFYYSWPTPQLGVKIGWLIEG